VTHLNGCGTLPLDETDECTLFPSLLGGRMVFSVTQDVLRGEAGREGSSHAGHCCKFFKENPSAMHPWHSPGTGLAGVFFCSVFDMVPRPQDAS
jgi:hypothetical protein